MNENEILERICALRKQFDDVKDKYSDDEGFVDSVNASLEENEFLSQEKIREDYLKNTEKDRLLRIGIVGAVKAGKSSLLNALFFNGNDILPKAATPMTAALTELSYGEKCEISVDFFTDMDVQELKKKSEDYKRELNRLTDENLKLKETAWINAQKRKDPMFQGVATSEQNQQWKKEAQQSAKFKMDSNVVLAGAFQQYEKIENSSVQRKIESESFFVDSIDSIAGKLEDYVGSNGKYMPFTSKVSIKLPIDALKEVCVIDTPGFNDPVPSRDDRARKALRECDVVLILSPSRQFISANDKDVISKITSKNGIRELYLVPSQVDSQLFNMEITDEANGDLSTALNRIKSILSEVTKKNLKDINKDGIFNELINETEKRLFPTSGICESMVKTIEAKENWDSGRKKVWENLTRNYPDYFSDSDIQTSKNSLNLLGNIGPIETCVKTVKVRKEDIFKEKLDAFESKYKNASNDAKNAILEYVASRETDLKNKDISKLEREIAETQKAYNLIGPELKESFIDCVMDWYEEVKSDFDNNLKIAKGEAKTGVSEAEGSYDETGYTCGGFLWLRKDYYTINHTTANVSVIKNSIDEYIDAYNDNLPHFLNTEIYRLTKKVMQKVQQTWTEYSTSGADSLVELRNKVRSTISAMDFEYDLEYKGEGFTFNASSSKLTDSEAEDCLAQAKDCINNLNREFKFILTSAIDDVLYKCKNCDFAKEVLEGYEKKLEKSKADLEKPKLALENFKRMKDDLEKIEC